MKGGLCNYNMNQQGGGGRQGAPALEAVDHNPVLFGKGDKLLVNYPLPNLLPLVALQLDHLTHLLIRHNVAVGVDCRGEGWGGNRGLGES